MEFHENSFLEELLSLKTDSWETIPKFATEMSELFSSGWNYNNCFNESPADSTLILPPNSFCNEFGSSLEQDFNNCYFNEAVFCPVDDHFSAVPQFTDDQFSTQHFTDSSYNTIDTTTPPFCVQEDTSMSMLEDENMGFIANEVQNMELQGGACKVEPIVSPEAVPVFNVGTCSSTPEKKVRGKKLEGQPSKNLMAERRRRKRLNDRLSMLRSIVPKISKMDRTSILGDTIDYMKELLERINKLQQQIEVDSDQLNKMNIFKESKANELIVRNSPKFDVQRRNEDTKIEICCATKPGLLLSTMTTLEALGLEVEQCVISCFNDFAMQASCSEELEQRKLISSGDIKQALFSTAGYGGQCL